MPHVVSLRNFPMSIGSMSHVDSKECPVALSNVRVKSPNMAHTVLTIVHSQGFICDGELTIFVLCLYNRIGALRVYYPFSCTNDAFFIHF